MDGVWYNVLLRLPLNLIRRLLGLNKRLNAILMNEILWRWKCEREFKVLPRTLFSYRYYYLMTTKNNYGRLFIAKRGELHPHPVERFDRTKNIMQINDNKRLVHDGDILYEADVNPPYNCKILFTNVDFFDHHLLRCLDGISNVFDLNQ